MSDKKFSDIFKKGWNIILKEEDMTKLRTKSLYGARVKMLERLTIGKIMKNIKKN